MGVHKNESVKIAYWNCDRGFVSKGKILEIGNYMHVNKIDICAVTEINIIKTTFHQPMTYEIEGYNSTYPSSWEKEGRARIILYSSKRVRHALTIRTDLMYDNQPTIIIQLSNTGMKKCNIAFYYREWSTWDGLNSQEEQLKRLQLFQTMTDKAMTNNSECIIIGDMNIDLNKSLTDCDRVHKSMLDYMEERELTQMIQENTRRRIVGNKLQESRIDHIYTNDTTKMSNIKVTPTAASDHSIISFHRVRAVKEEKHMQIRRTFKHFKKDKFLEDLSRRYWDLILETDDVDIAAGWLDSFITDTLDRHAPKVTILPRKHYVGGLKEETKHAMRERDLAHEKCKKTLNKDDIDSWKRMRNKVTGMILKDKKACQQKIMENTESAWGYMARQMGRSKKGGPPEILNIGGQLVTKKKEIATHMNKHFTTKVKTNRLKVNLNQPTLDPIKYLREQAERQGNRIKDKLELHSVSEQDVKKLISELTSSNSTGMDGISTDVLKISKEVIAKPLTYIINLSLRRGQFPTIWKDAKIIPLHKKKIKTSPQNYRPIALLAKLSLILEKIVHNQISTYFTANNLFTDNQNGYIKGKGTTTALTTIYDRWVRGADKSKFTGVLCMDMTAAFDLVDISILIEKMKIYGANDTTVNWIQSYLTNRRQCVSMGAAESEFLDLECGVPQGSTLGPLLFNIFVNDLPSVTKNGVCDMYADDSATSFSHKEISVIREKLNEDAREISIWMVGNKLLLCPEKTEFMIAADKSKIRTDQQNDVTLNVDGHTIKQSNFVKLLGVILSRDLNFNYFIQGTPAGTDDEKKDKGLINHLKTRINMLKLVAKYTPRPIMKILGSGIFHGKLNYAAAMWGGVGEGLLKQIQVIQNKAARAITGLRYETPIRELLQEAGWMTVRNIIKYQSICLIYNIRLNGSSKHIWKYIMNNRSQISGTIPTYETTQILALSRSFIPRATRDWNELPREVRCSLPSEFKSTLKTHLRLQNQ